MMKARGHTIIHYGNEMSEVPCDEHVTVVTKEDLEIAYGSYDWKKNFFKHSTDDHAHKTFNKNASREVAARKKPGDFLLCFWGWGHKPTADANSDMLVVEPGIGYTGDGGWQARWRVFESYAIYHQTAGRLNKGPDWYHVVIPNYFDPEEFEFSAEKDDYVLCLGRIITSKGTHVAIQAAQAAGKRILIAGQGSLADVGYPDPLPSGIEYVGYADVEKRKKLMSKAQSFIIPSNYYEPFGGVMVEAMMSGTPVITVDWGAATEIVPHGITGYRCRTFEQFVWAIKNTEKIDPHTCRAWAMNNFSLDKVSKMYEEYFQSVANVSNGKGWYEKNPDRKELDWLERSFKL
jgi:glycosyltransferase involved in cell wall biosynthesis